MQVSVPWNYRNDWPTGAESHKAHSKSISDCSRSLPSTPEIRRHHVNIPGSVEEAAETVRYSLGLLETILGQRSVVPSANQPFHRVAGLWMSDNDYFSHYLILWP